jgi:hypothetical protein
MSYIPDCREDGYYNVDRLEEGDKREVKGYDWCAEEVVDNFFSNDMGGLCDPETYLGHLLSEKLPEEMRESYEMEFSFGDREPEERVVETYADLIRSRLLDWMESSRDEMIVSMIDSYEEEE